MLKITRNLILSLLIIVLLYACGTKKDTFTRRKYQALTTQYNVLFNGEEAFKNGIEDINNNYKDDWFRRLPIEPIDFKEDVIVAPSFSNSGLGAGFDGNKNQEKKELTKFELAEEKAIKAIQKHSMNFNGVERNSKIDDAYLLLGKSRYYQQRLIPAIEAFNYVISSYPDADLINETKIWRAKANLRNDNEDVAIESMKFLLIIKDTLERELPDQIKEQGYTALAMAYVKSDSLQKAKESLHLATRTLENENQGARNLFILGQMYADEGKKDSANLMFNRIINFKKAPYKYKIHANIELAKNATNDSTSAVVLKTLNKLIKNRDNRLYLDELYYQRAVLYEKNDSIDLAIKDYNNSLRTKNAGNKQKTYTYENLGNLSFKNDEYLAASAYYDSVMQITTDSLDLRIRRIDRKRKNLASLIKFEETVTVNDSILKLVAMTKEEQQQFFEDYIVKIKKADEDAAQRRLNQLNFGTVGGGLGAEKGSWYFYNNQSLAFGKTEFKKVWGNRKLEDNWRWSEKSTGNKINNVENQTTQTNARYDVKNYLSQIPSEKTVIDSLQSSRNQALYELGLIYKEQFNNPNLAKQRLEKVYDLQPSEELILPINWHLYQLYKTEDVAKASIYKNTIINNYPDTKFAQIILNPDAELTKEDEAITDIEEKYKELYYLYKENKYEDVVTKVDELLPTIQNAELLPKFELLKAYAIGKYQDKKAYSDALKYVFVSYGNTDEGKKAKEILALLEK